MGYSKIPKLPRNRYNYTGPSYSEYGAPNAILKAVNAGGGTGGGTITNTTLSAMSKVVQQYADEKGFVTPDDIKTVNGYSLIGYGDIEVTSEGTVDLSAYATKTYVNSEIESAILSAYSYTSYKISEIPQADLSAYATKTYVESETQQLKSYMTSYVNDEVEAAKLAAYAYATSEAAAVKAASYAYTASEIDSKVTGFVTYSQLSSYVTKTQLDTAGYVTESQLTQASYATKSYVSEKIEAIPQADLSAYATKAYVNEKIEAIPQADLSAYALKTDLNSYVTKTELENAGYLTTHQDLSAYMKKSDMASYATKAYVSTKAQEIVSSGSYITSNDVSNMGYVTTSELSQASYVTSNALDTKLASYMKKSDMSSYVSKTELNNASYVPQSQLTEASYATSVAVEESLGKYVQLTYLDEKLDNVMSTYTYAYEGTYYTAKDTDGVIILKAANTTLNLPTEGIKEGKMITVINKTGSSFQAASNGGLINKESSAQQPQQRISYMVSQYIYIEGSWYVI